ncbi:hypothetical protein EXIGLDRAFT_709620 [Exidia glandulosa HHB12029]|uniref:Alpha/beta-hydrolase n=1 Tax=Exidia glandulosa HHB12029 TaxID=1314781 RepID=A0A165QYV8_EXIGL|nr:hypothetical protein EXIGLDRAFT_709620 [Exidia glandulosa HHB12029]
MHPRSLDVDEHPRPPLRRSRSFYLCLVLLVAPVYSLVPLSWAYVLYSLATLHTLLDGWQWSWLHRALFLYCLSEVLFSLYHYKLYRSVAEVPAPAPVDIHLLRTCLTRVLEAGMVSASSSGDEKAATVAVDPMAIFEPLAADDPRAVDFRDRLRTWFRGIPWSAIHQHEMYAWLYWATFGEHFTGLDDIPDGHRAALQDALQLLQYRIGRTLPEGSNPAGRPYLLKLDAISVWGRPFVYYAFIASVNHLIRRHFSRKHGARVGRFRQLEYILHVPESWEPSGPNPIVFFHGLGVGFLQYSQLIHRLLDEFPDRPVLVLRQPSISQEIFHPRHLQPMARAEMVESMYALLENLGWTTYGVTVLSHSNGSIPHAWLVKEYPRLVRRSCFVDPVVFCTWEGDVCYNFVYRPPTDGLRLLMRYFVGTELGIANTIQRHFDWADNTLWFEEIPNAHDSASTKFYLGGRDAIVASEVSSSRRVRRYLLAHGAHDGAGVVWNPNGVHGEAMLHRGRDLDDIFSWLAQNQGHVTVKS